MQDVIEALEARREKARLGGGKARIERQHEKGRREGYMREKYAMHRFPLQITRAQ